MALSKYGRYETLHRIASGGMASVYLGRHLGAGGFERLVAIKVMHDHIADDPSFSAMFLDEARIAAQIRHPNVVPTLDVADDGRYIVMEYVEGASLQAILTARRKERLGPLPLPIALCIFLDALAGLHAAHELTDTKNDPQNLVHRDISPHNVLVGVDGMSRITDFGIAFAEARLTSTRSGQLKGKLPYMSPEQLEDGQVTRTTDVYAAGCVLWEMLSNKRLFRGSNEAAVACAVLAGPDRTVRDVRPDVPAAVDVACMRALLRDTERYPTALAFAEALEEAAESAGIRIAKHRDVGAFAQLAEMTYPAASTFTDSDDDPRPKALMAELAAQSSEAPATRRTSPDTIVRSPASATLVTPEPEPSALPLGEGRTTREDRPPPEVAAVIRAAIARESEPASERVFDDTSVVIPKERSWGSVAVAGLVAVGVALAIVWFTQGREADAVEASSPARASTSASAATSSTEAPQITAPPVASVSAAPATAAAPSREPEARAPWPAVVPPPVARPTRPEPQPSARPAPPKPSPSSTGGEYHPANP